MADPNIELLRAAVLRLGNLADELVFVGGCTTGLFITDPAAAEVRPTVDVDAIVEAVTYVQYMDFEKRLQEKGFMRDIREGAPICRWVSEEIVLDVMPVEEVVLGFRNRWYRDAVDTAQSRNIIDDLKIKVITPPYFCATKLDAFEDRGKKDYFGSNDLEDVIAVVDGRLELIEEIGQTSLDVRAYIAEYIHNLLQENKFRDALPGYLLPDEASKEGFQFLWID